MRSQITIQNFTQSKIPPRFLKRAQFLLKITNKLIRGNLNEVGVVLVRPNIIRSLNHVYRGHNKVTDILSFTYQTKPIIGELLICTLQTKQQAQRAGVSFNNELERLFVHGCLHLAGYDHMKEKERRVMRTLEEKVLNN
jgi:probable rRNA maturation factor